MDEAETKEEATQIAQAIASDCVGARIRMLNRTLSRLYDERVRPHGLRFSQMNILTVVTLHGPIQPVDIARLLSLEKSTVSRNVALMQENGWIRNLPAEGNTRHLKVTHRGHELLLKAAPGWQEAQEQVVFLLGQETSAELCQAADRLAEASVS